MDFSKVEELLPESVSKNIEFEEQLHNIVNSFSLTVAKQTSDFLVTFPKKILQFFVMLFIMFYMFKEGKSWLEKIKRHIPLKESHRKNLATKFSGVIYASLYGIVITAIVQGSIGAVGLWCLMFLLLFFGVLLCIILAMLPVVGAFWCGFLLLYIN